MPYLKITIHAVWGTKRREPFLTKGIRDKVIQHIRSNARAKGIFIIAINGYLDHLHCLFNLNADMTIAKALQLMKGESAHWMNKNQMTRKKFEWASEYFAASVSESSIKTVQAYIEGQEEHHAKPSFTRDYNDNIQELDINKSTPG